MGQTSVSTLSQQPEGSVDGLDKPAITNSDGPNSGSQSPPLKRKGKLSSIGKIFKPWKWRKKKASEKFRETSAVLERKISTRQSREELIRRGLLKEIPDQDGGVPANVETSNGHMIVVSEEAPSEAKVSNNIGAGNGSVPTKAAKGEEDKTEANSSLAKKTLAGKASSSSPSSSRPKASKDQAASKAGTSGTPRINKKPTKQLSVPAEDSNLPASANTAKPPVVVIVEAPTDNPTTDVEESSPEQPPLNSESEATGQEQPLSPTEQPVPAAITPPPSQDNQPSALSNAQDNEQTSSPVFLLTPALDCGQLLQSEPETDNHKINLHQENFLTVNGEITICCSSSIDENSLKEAEDLQRQETTDESSEESNPQDSESENKENTTNDSDSDGPILYTDDDDDDDDDDDGSAQSSLASKIRRKDSLAIKLGNRPSKKELEDKNILQRTSEEERQEKWQQIGTKLVRRLSQRPTTEELEQRNILKQKNEEEEQEARRELKRRLTRKLSLRPSVAELQARRILRFNEYVEVTDSLDYDRRADKPWARLTPADKAAIRKELNDFKSTEMEVHEESRHFTRFHRP